MTNFFKGFKLLAIKLIFETAWKLSPKKHSYQNKWISLQDFHALFREAGLTAGELTEQELYLIFL